MVEDKFVEPWVASAVVLSGTFLGCVTMRFLFNAMPDSVHGLAQDFWTTLEITAYFFENNFILEVYGYGWLCAVVLAQLSVLSARSSLDNPLKAVQAYMLEDDYLPTYLAAQLAVMTLGGVAAYYLSWLVWTLEMTPSHMQRANEDSCQSALQVDVIKGVLVEGGGVFMDFYMRLEPISSNNQGDLLIKNTFATLCVAWGTARTGAYCNPAMALGMDLGCEGTAGLTHMIVFWAAPTAGVMAAVWLNESSRENHSLISAFFYLVVVILCILFF